MESGERARDVRRLKVTYKITYPNGKIYVGQDRTGSANYLGSAASDLIAADFTAAELRDCTIRKQILWESETATPAEVTAKELEFIRFLGSNDPAVGYNRSPRPRQAPQAEPGSGAYPTS